MAGEAVADWTARSGAADVRLNALRGGPAPIGAPFAIGPAGERRARQRRAGGRARSETVATGFVDEGVASPVAGGVAADGRGVVHRAVPLAVADPVRPAALRRLLLAGVVN